MGRPTQPHTVHPPQYDQAGRPRNGGGDLGCAGAQAEDAGRHPWGGGDARGQRHAPRSDLCALRADVLRRVRGAVAGRLVDPSRGAVFVDGSEGLHIDGCAFVRVGGNALFLSGHAWHTLVENSEFLLVGDSAIATVGDIALNDGVSSQRYPLETRIMGNHFHEIGVTGKQTSAWFSAVSCRTTFAGNVAYNGPRAGINLNDGFCHGHRIENNLLFNWVRETQDHGPINTWNRAAYMHLGVDGVPTDVPEWTHISKNFIMNGPTGNRDLGNLFPAIDNDDGSAYFSAEGNVLVYGGAKNYLGHDKRWVGNLILFPDRWSGDPCAQIWGGESHWYVSNECVMGKSGDALGLDGTRKGFHCMIDFSDPGNAALVGNTHSNIYYTHGGWGFACGNRTGPNHRWTLPELQSAGRETGSVDRQAGELTVAALSAKVVALLGL